MYYQDKWLLSFFFFLSCFFYWKGLIIFPLLLMGKICLIYILVDSRPRIWNGLRTFLNYHCISKLRQLKNQLTGTCVWMWVCCTSYCCTIVAPRWLSILFMASKCYRTNQIWIFFSWQSPALVQEFVNFQGVVSYCLPCGSLGSVACLILVEAIRYCFHL